MLWSLCASSNYSWVQVGVDGLTCSQCSRSVEMCIRKLSFVQDVVMNLANTEGKITFKPGTKVDIKKIAQAVVDAGFSVRYISAGFVFENASISENSCFPFEENQFQFVKVDPKTLNGETTLKFIGKKFLNPKEFRKWKGSLQPVCDKLKGEILYVTL
jgi:copper chaperone CopZ